MDEEFKNQTKLEAFRQNWEETRHNENMRLTFTSLYAVIVAALLTFISQSESVEKSYVYIVLSVLGLLGFIICIRLRNSIEAFSNNIKELAGELTGEGAEVKDEKECKKLQKYSPFWKSTRWYHVWTIRVLFIWLFFGAMVLFAVLAALAD